MRKRTKPYTAIGIKRVPCFRCGLPSEHQWNICSDGNEYRGICNRCDIKLNELVLRFMGFPDWKEKITAYKLRKINNV